MSNESRYREALEKIVRLYDEYPSPFSCASVMLHAAKDALAAPDTEGERDFTPEEALEEANKRFSSGGKNAVAVEVYLSKWDEIPEMKQTPPKYKISGIYKNQEFTGDSFRACFDAADKLQIVDGQPVREGTLE